MHTFIKFAKIVAMTLGAILLLNVVAEGANKAVHAIKER